MRKMYVYWRWLWMAAALSCLSTAGGMSVGGIEPVGTEAGLIQFDVTTELTRDDSFTHWVVFARYWVCKDYYGVSVVWSEPHGSGMVDMKTLVILSDGEGFRIADEKYDFWVPMNTTYSKPVGERGPFRWGGGPYEGAEIRFAEAEAIARRVHASDLANQQANGVIDVKVPEATDGTKRDLARVKATVKGRRIESMELFDGQQRSLGRMKYGYDRAGGSSALAKLIADLPVRPEKLACNVRVTATPFSGGEATVTEVKEAKHVSHRGGRTCTVTYKGVTVGDKVLRLPVHVEVRVTENKRFLRSARLSNFQRVDLDKGGVWEAARAFCHLSDEDQAYYKLGGKYLNPSPKFGPMRVDPDDPTCVRRLIAKYPVWKLPPAPTPNASEILEIQKEHELALEVQMQRIRMRDEARKREQAQWNEQVARMPRPPRLDIEPDDLRAIRQLDRYYGKRILEESKPSGFVPERLQEISHLRDDLSSILGYHRAPHLPEDQAPELELTDRDRVRQLQVHYERLAAQSDRGLGGQLKAVHTLSCLDRILKDYDAFEGHAVRYLQMVQDANLAGTYMVGGHRIIETLVVAGQYEKANKLLRQWADVSAAENGADVVYRFAGWDVEGSKRDPWAALQVLDGFLKRPGLSRIQRYEGLAWRAIALHKADRLLSDPRAAESDLRKAQVRWILSTTKREDLAKRVELALGQALSAWQALGRAQFTEAKPYSTMSIGGPTMNRMDLPEATKLQEVSAVLDSIIRERGAPVGGMSATNRPDR